jgi:hypothetical protein
LGAPRGYAVLRWLELGQAADYTALAVVQTVAQVNPAGGREQYLHLRHLERYDLGTPYPEIADKVASLVRSPSLMPQEYDPSRLRYFRKPPELIVDDTGVGRAVTDLLKTKGLKFKAVTITGGDEVHAVGGGRYRVPKRDLVGALEVPFHTGRLKIAEGMELWPALKKELLNFRRKIKLKTAHDSYEHWRESDHDDLVLAAALACWWITRRQRGTLRVRFKPPGF